MRKFMQRAKNPSTQSGAEGGSDALRIAGKSGVVTSILRETAIVND